MKYIFPAYLPFFVLFYLFSICICIIVLKVVSN